MPVYALLLEYDGSEYSGWQRQHAQPTIQATVEEALQTFLRCDPLRVTGSGRTDSGVHARGQVAHFECDVIPDDLLRQIVHALNGLLPASITVRAAVNTHEGFHARYDATRRVYHYYISRVPLAIERNHRLFVLHKLNFERMNYACNRLIGTQHFGAFCRTSSTTVNRICSVHYAQWEPETPTGYWRFVIEADRFLHGMVRSIVGTLLDIGRGQRTPKDLEYILSTQDRREAGPSAPAHALVLDHVSYPILIFEN